MGSRASATPPLPLYLGFGPRGGLRGLALLTCRGADGRMGAPRTRVRGDAGARRCLRLATRVDVLRIGAWYAFLLLLIEASAGRSGRRGTATHRRG